MTVVDISIVIPVFNSEKILPELCKQLNNVLAMHKSEIILVDDGSKDNSWEVITKLSHDWPIKGLKLARNFGQDNAIMAGLHQSIGKFVVIMDDDLQHSPSDIEILLKEIKDKEVDICYADYSNNKKQSLWKNLGSFLNSKQAEYFIGKPKEIYLSPFKIMHKSVVESILQYQGSYPYIDGLIFQSTSSVIQIPIDHNLRIDGKSNYNFRNSASVFLKHTTGFSVVPLRVSSAIGFVFAILGFFLGIFYFYQYITSDISEGWTTIVSLLLLIGGLALISLGVIGEYIGRIYLTINNRPQFIIKDKAL